jgi:hypothetical protein
MRMTIGKGLIKTGKRTQSDNKDVSPTEKYKNVYNV